MRVQDIEMQVGYHSTLLQATHHLGEVEVASSKVFSILQYLFLIWLVVEPTHSKNISQNGNLHQIGVEIKNS